MNTQARATGITDPALDLLQLTLYISSDLYNTFQKEMT